MISNQTMDVIFIILIFAFWFTLFRWVLPRMGVPT
jgi:hypothetical protein